MPKQTGNIVLDLKISGHPHPNWYKGKSLVFCTKADNINVKLTLFLACGFICHSYKA